MSSLVHELQQAALDEKSSVSSLLRKALLVASKLDVADFEAWARNELEGYASVPVPEYRQVRGTPMVWNPFRGYQHLTADSAEMSESLSLMGLHFAVDALEDSKDKTAAGGLMLSYSAETEHALMEAMNFPLKPSLRISAADVRAVLGRVRTIILEWSLKLEKLGVIGAGMTFSATERAQASSVNIETFIQDVTGSQIQVNSPEGNQQQTVTGQEVSDIKALVELVTNAMRSGTASDDRRRELQAELNTLRAQSESPRPKRRVLKEALKSLRGILEGAGGELLAAHLPEAMALVGMLLQSFN